MLAECVGGGESIEKSGTVRGLGTYQCLQEQGHRTGYVAVSQCVFDCSEHQRMIEQTETLPEAGAQPGFMLNHTVLSCQ